MKIAMVSEHASPLATAADGGQSLHVAELSTALQRGNHEVTVYTRRSAPNEDTEVSTPQGYRVVHIDAGPAAPVARDDLLPHMGHFATELREHLRRSAPDVVHAHFWMSGLASLLATHELCLPVVQTFHTLGTVEHHHQGDADTSPPERIATERMIGRRAARIVATCADEQFELTRMGVSRSRITIVPWGVDVQRFAPGRRRARRGGPYRIVMAGRLLPHNGFDTAVEALTLLPDTELIIAGGPARNKLRTDPAAQSLRAKAEQLGVNDRVKLTGHVSRRKMPDLLRSADAVVCVPSYESFGLVPLEAMACGIPVVASAVGGLTDTVVDHVTGLHVPARDPGALASALLRLFEDDVMNETYGIAGRDRVVARYSWDRVAMDIVRAYQPSAAGSPRPAHPAGERS